VALLLAWLRDLELLRREEREGDEPLPLLLLSPGAEAVEEPERTLSIFFLVERVNFIMVVQLNNADDVLLFLLLLLVDGPRLDD